MNNLRDAAAIVLSAALSLSLAAHASAGSASIPDSLSWVTVGSGVQYATADSVLGDDVFLGFGGWTVQQEWADNWVSELYSAKLRALGVRHLYAVKGPVDDDYYSREIGTRDLARHLVLLLESTSPNKRIIIAAHSSGSYVSHALFQDLYEGASIDSNHITDGKIVYFNLDGGIGAGGSGVEITQGMADHLGHIYGVFAFVRASNLYSPNMAEMVELGDKFGSRSSSFPIDASGCGCTGKWCVHETLINQKPYSHTTFDLKNDYGSINADHPVATAYLDVITALDDRSVNPDGFYLRQNYPNPFNPSTTIKYELPRSSEVRLSVYDMLGRKISVLANERRDAGSHEVKFDATGLASGVYIYRLQSGDFVQSRKLVIVR